MQHEWTSALFIALLLIAFLSFGVLALRKSQARRREQFGEPELPPSQKVPEPKTPPEPVAKPLPVAKPVPPVAKPEPAAKPVEPVTKPEPVAKPVEPVTKPEPVAKPVEPVTKPEPVAKPVEPVAKPEPVARPVEPVSKPEPAAKPEPVAKPTEPVAKPEAAKPLVVVAPPVEPAKPTEAPAAPTAAPAAKAEADAALKAGLAKTHASFFGRINQLFSRRPAIDPAVLDELEDVLLTADVGVNLAMRLVDDLRQRLKDKKLADVDAVKDALRQQLATALAAGGPTATLESLTAGDAKPQVILFVGVNGVGKTTTIGKIAAQLHDANKKVLLAAGDTFRAAAAAQLSIWAERAGAEIVQGKEGADPASVIFNAVDAAKQKQIDIVLADTAGRLHTKTELMDEIKKVKRAASKARDGAPDETWLVVDGTTGQNALQQAREFHQALELTGVILTKLDGTAKGGVVVAIVDALKIPVRFVGVGEKAGDLRVFDADSFIAALFDPA